MAPTKWSSRLETKLSALSESSSKESIQTLARWLGFNRKHSEAFSNSFSETLVKATASKQVVILSVIHEVLMMERQSAKWDRLANLRLALGDKSLLSISNQLNAKARDKMKEYLKDWDESNVFGGPTLISQIGKQISTPPKADQESKGSVEIGESSSAVNEPKTTETETTTASPAVSTKPSETGPGAEDSNESIKVAPAPSPREVTKDSIAPPAPTSVAKEVEYDFESKGIPAGKVDAREFVDPSKAIATLQIARDLRNDGAVQLSSLLSSMPEDVRAACAESAEVGDSFTIGEMKAWDFSMRTNETLIDMELEDELQSVRTFREIVQKQRQARLQLIQLLVKSRCKFGAEEAARAFYRADRAEGELARRKQILADTMELEGLDVEEEDKSAIPLKDELPPLSWFQEEAGEGDAPDAKRRRISE